MSPTEEQAAAGIKDHILVENGTQWDLIISVMYSVVASVLMVIYNV